MSNPSRRTGSEWETRLEGYLRGRFGNAERMPLSGVNDQGDLFFHWQGRAFVIEAKAERKINLSAYVTEAKAEAQNWWNKRKAQWPMPHPIAIVKRRNHSVGKSYVVLELDEFVRLVKEGSS